MPPRTTPIPIEPQPAPGRPSYLAELCTLYLSPSTPYPRPTPTVPPRGADRTGGTADSDPNRRIDRLDSDAQTLGDIIARGYLAVPAIDSATAVLADKHETARIGLDDMIEQARGRFEVYRRNMHELLKARVAACNAFHDWYALSGLPTESQLGAYHTIMQRLYAQQRDERVLLWRDLSRLRLAMPPAMQAYLSAHRRLDLLNELGGDVP